MIGIICAALSAVGFVYMDVDPMTAKTWFGFTVLAFIVGAIESYLPTGKTSMRTGNVLLGFILQVIVWFLVAMVLAAGQVAQGVKP